MQINHSASVATINLVEDWTRPGVHLPVFAGSDVTTIPIWADAHREAVRRSAGVAGAQGIFMRERDGVQSFELRALETVDFTMATAAIGTARRGLELLQGSNSNPSLRDSTGRLVSSNGSIGSDTNLQPKRSEFGQLLAMVDGDLTYQLNFL